MNRGSGGYRPGEEHTPSNVGPTHPRDPLQTQIGGKMSKKTLVRQLKEQEVSEKLGIGLSTLRNWRSKPPADPLPYIKIGNMVRYPEDTTIEWLARRVVHDTLEASRLKTAV